MQKIRSIAVLSLSLLLVGCGVSYTLFQTDQFSLEVPETWQQVLPKEGTGIQLEALFVMLDAEGNPTLSFNVVRKDFTNALVLDDFIAANIEEAGRVQGFEELDEESLRVGDFKTKLLTFKALDTETGNPKQFMQTYLTHGEQGFVLTASMNVDPESDLPTQVKKVMRSFTFKNTES